ncbi:MAG TPA: response regulator transcription factor [Sulfurospirillum arcachonense]|nr:response regulator transcription factor [Sulfurospirillum arcachonense]HIP45074.1 response regulator transcription factor [Sulfurospirillum arcachonense]
MLEKHEIILNKSSILLAEDDQNVSESFERVLLLFVDKVYRAQNGEEALKLFKKYNPDIIITDIKMPKMNGLELIKKIREDDHDTPIIVTSAYTDQDFLLESIKLSLVEYVVKPIKESDLNRLLNECAKVLEKKTTTIIELNSTCRYDFDNKVFTCKDKNIVLTHKEVEFFEILLAHRGTLVTKHAIEDKLYIYEEAPPSALKNLVFKLRKKIGDNLIKTVNKLGYIIE